MQNTPRTFPFCSPGGIYILKNLFLDEGLLYADGFDDCIIGLTYREKTPVVLYNSRKIIESLAKDMTDEEALEFFEYNIEGAYVGERTPIYWNDYDA
jgi:hypothetical protein